MPARRCSSPARRSRRRRGECSSRSGARRPGRVGEYEAWIAEHDAVDPGARGASGDTVVQMYTSGTTGVPKGVLTTHRNLAAAAETSPLWAFDAARVSLTPLPMFHIGGIGWAFVGLWNGATTILVSDFDPRPCSICSSAGG